MPIALTLPVILSRCDEVGACCWLWKQGTTGTGSPIARNNGKQVVVRREAFAMLNGRAAKSGWFVIAKCQQSLCVSPYCAVEMDGPQYMRWLNTHGYINGPLQSIAKSVAAGKRSKLSDSDARKVHDLINTGADRGVVAKLYGISRGYANRIARKKHRVREAPNASVFNLRA